MSYPGWTIRAYELLIIRTFKGFLKRKRINTSKIICGYVIAKSAKNR